MYKQVLPAVLAAYGIKNYTVGSMQKGYRNESYPVTITKGSIVNLIFFKKEPDIMYRVQRADATASAAFRNGLPVRTRYDERIIKVTSDRYAGLYTYLPGSTIEWEAMTMRHIKLLGQAMGDLHTSLKHVLPQDNYEVTDDLIPLIERMQSYFQQPDVTKAMSSKLSISIDQTVFVSFMRVLGYTSKLDGKQMIHMDLVRGNVLFSKTQTNDRWRIDDFALTGIIDFEKAGYGHPVLDVARTMAFLIVDSQKPMNKIHRYFLDSGYHKRGGQPLPDPRVLTLLTRFFLLHDFYKFLRYTPYESLKHNYHYTRTCELLKTYGIIK